MKNQLIAAGLFAAVSKCTSFLFKNIWKENTTALLLAPRETDKTDKALDIAGDLCSTGHKVVYVDTNNRLSDHRERLSALDGMFVLRPEYESPEDRTDFADLVINAIEEAAKSSGIQTFIIDSVTRIAALSFGRNASAAYVMKRLVALQVRYGLSLLVLADEGAKASNRALINLADTEFSEISEASDNSELSECPESSVSSDCSDASLRALASSALPLTRRQRRALARRIAKGKIKVDC